jgi:hypothetical protein
MTPFWKSSFGSLHRIVKIFEVDIGTFERRLPSSGEITSRVREDKASTNFPFI